MNARLMQAPLRKLNQFMLPYFGDRARETLYFSMLAWMCVSTTFDFMRTDLAVFKVSVPLLWLAILGILLFYIYVFCDYSLWQLALISLVFLITGISAVFSRQVAIFRLFAFVFAAKGLSYRKLSRFMFCTLAFCVAFVLLASCIDWAEDYIITRSEAIGRGIQRHSLGYDTANGIGLFLLSMFLCGYMAGLNHWEKLAYFVLFFLYSLVIFLLTNSKSFLVCMVLMLSAILVLPYVQRLDLKKQILFFTLGYVLFWLAMSLILHCCDDAKPFYHTLNVLLSGRIWMGKVGFDTYGISLFGTSALFDMPIDCLHASLPIRYGFLTTLVYMLMFYLANLRCLFKGQTLTALFGIALLFLGINESAVLIPTFNIVMFTISADLEKEDSYVALFRQRRHSRL